jgi:hypothetical protein
MKIPYINPYIKTINICSNNYPPDFVKEYESILKECKMKYITEETRLYIVEKWARFIVKLIDTNLIDKEVGNSLIKLFELIITIN